MKKKKLKDLALKGICGGLLMSAQGLAAAQGSDAMANFVANSSGEAHSHYLAGSCGGGSCGGGGNRGGNLTAYETPQSQMGWNGYQYQGQTCSSGSNYQSSSQGYSTCSAGSYQPSYQGYSNCRSGSSYQGHTCSGGSNYQPSSQGHGGCGGPGGCGHANRNQANSANQSYANTNKANDGTQTQYDNSQHQQNNWAKPQGQTALNDSASRSWNDAQNLNRNAQGNPSNSNQWQNAQNAARGQNPQSQSWQQNQQNPSWQQNQQNPSWQQQQSGQSNPAGQTIPKSPLAAGAVPTDPKTKNDYDALKNKADSTNPAGKTVTPGSTR